MKKISKNKIISFFEDFLNHYDFLEKHYVTFNAFTDRTGESSVEAVYTGRYKMDEANIT
jgi:hypothetical protein